jgi:hypothetical protein
VGVTDNSEIKTLPLGGRKSEILEDDNSKGKNGEKFG